MKILTGGAGILLLSIGLGLLLHTETMPFTKGGDIAGKIKRVLAHRGERIVKFVIFTNLRKKISLSPVVDKEELEEFISSWLAVAVPPDLVPSIAVGIVSNEGLLVSRGLNADIDRKYGIASLSKTFTAILVLQLADERKLGIDDPVRTHLPGVVIERDETSGGPVTLRHLMSHTSGVRDREFTEVEIKGKKLKIPKQYEPAGSTYHYSNAGFVILKEVIEAVSGETYGSLIKKRIFDPLEMNSSSGNSSNGTGGIITTIRDLSNYAAMLINRGEFRGKRILSEDSFVEMLMPVSIPGMEGDTGYSLSWKVSVKDNTIIWFQKAGRWWNESSELLAFPRRNIGYIYLCDPPDHLSKEFMDWRNELVQMLRECLKDIRVEKDERNRKKQEPSPAKQS